MEKNKTKEINIKIMHELTPMHAEIMTNLVTNMMDSLLLYWKTKSKKDFHIKIDLKKN